jgi:MFS family permease
VSRLSRSIGRTFGSLRSSRNFRLYVLGQLISAAGTWINATALAWLVLRLTDSGIALGVATSLLFLPVLLFGAWGGVLADRFDKRRILLLTQSAFAVIALALWALVATDRIELWIVYVLSFTNGLATAVDNPTRQSFYVEMVGEEALTNAISLFSAAFTGARIVGPAIAGALIATVGIAICFLVDAVSYVAVIVALLMIRPAELYPQAKSTREKGHLMAGLRYVWRTDELRRPLIVMGVIFTLSFNFSVLVPLLAERTFDGDAGTFGALSALAGLGSFAGALLMANRDARPTMRRFAAFAAAAGATQLLVAVSPTLDWALVAMIGVGATMMIFMITANSLLQLSSVPQARGRVMALYGIVFLGSTPIGSPIAGWVAQHLGTLATGPRIGFALGGLIAVAMGLGLLWRLARSGDASVEDPRTATDPVQGLPGTATTTG